MLLSDPWTLALAALESAVSIALWNFICGVVYMEYLKSTLRKEGMAIQSACICASALRATPAIHSPEGTNGHEGRFLNANCS